MILIADGGSTKADWIALDANKNERFRVRTLGLNPAVISSEELTNRIVNMFFMCFLFKNYNLIGVF